MKKRIILALIAAGAVIIGAFFSPLGQALGERLFGSRSSGGSDVTVAATVKDRRCNRAVSADVGILKLNGSLVGTFQRTDSHGQVSLQAPTDVAEVFIVVKAVGYEEYREKVPAQAQSIVVTLESVPIRRGIPDGAALDSVRALLEGDINARIDFNPGCSSKARNAQVASASIAGYRCAPAEYINQALARIKGRPATYRVAEIVPLQRYEIECH